MLETIADRSTLMYIYHDTYSRNTMKLYEVADQPMKFILILNHSIIKWFFLWLDI